MGTQPGNTLIGTVWIAGALPEAVGQQGVIGKLTEIGMHASSQRPLAVATFEDGNEFAGTQLLGGGNQ